MAKYHELIMKCRYCGKAIPDNSGVCDKCFHKYEKTNITDLIMCNRVQEIMRSNEMFEINPALSIQRRQILCKTISKGFFVSFNVFVDGDLYGILTITMNSAAEDTDLLESDEEDWMEVQRDVIDYLIS